MSEHEIADRNVERLLNVAYRPEPIDPAFVREVDDKLLKAASRAEREHRTSPGESPQLLRLRRRLSWSMVAAGAAAACFLVYYAITHPGPVRFDGGVHAPSAIAKPKHAERPAFVYGLTARPRPESAKPQGLEVGVTLTTKHNERRRVVLADGSILFVNENTTLAHVAARQLRLDRGEVYLEVAPKSEDQRFVVNTPERQFTAVGTHFHVAATAAGSGVLVTQGKVKVSDVAREVPAGEQVKPNSKQASVAPRASHVLDWLKPLVAAADAALVPARKHDGGALIALDPNGQELQLTLRKYHIDVHIEDGFARTTIDQTYFNNTWSRLEGTFYFPLPPDASLSRLAMYVVDGADCKLMEGGMAERDHARNAFETIRHERRDPALLEWVDGSTFKMRVFPLEAWQEKRIILSYTQRMPSLYGVTKYRFPGGHNMQVVRDWSFEAHIKNAKNWDVLTPSHPDMQRTDAANANADTLTLRADARLIKPESDVVLELREREALADGATFATYLQDGQRYFAARYRPKLDSRPQRQRRDWIVLFETSANRDPLLARTQIDVVRNLLRNVEYDDTFALLTANTRVREFAAAPQAATPANVQAAVAYLEKSHLIGGLDLEAALRKALAVAKTATNPHLVHVGAGVPSLGEAKDDVLAKLIPDGVRYVGVGIGKKWNRALMKMAADRTGGYFTQINPDEPVAWRAFDLLATLNTPRLLDVRIVDTTEKTAYLTDAATLAEGEDVWAFARGATDKFDLPKKVLVTGKIDGKPFVREVEVRNVVQGAGYLPRTWAKLEIDRLLADGQDKHRPAITELSKAMYVMSPFTSLLVLETEADYKRFNIDRGRKDHWAMYGCPERIPLVHEPDPAHRAWWQHVEQPKDGKKPSVEQVLDTILLRLPPQYVFMSGQQVHLPPTATARQLLQTGYGMPLVEELSDTEDRFSNLAERTGVAERSAWRLNEWFRQVQDTPLSGPKGEAETRLWEDQRQRGVTRALEQLIDSRRSNLGRRSGAVRQPTSRADWTMRFQQLERREADDGLDFEFFGRRSTENFLFLRERVEATDFTMDEGRIENERLFGEMGRARQPRFALERAKARMPLRLGGVSADFKKGSTPLFEDLPNGLPTSPPLHLNFTTSSFDGVVWPDHLKTSLADAWIRELATRIPTRQSAQELVYRRPQHQVDQRLFADLTIHAPGLNATWDDLQNTIAVEAAQERPPTIGKIDDAARTLIDRARRSGWFAIAQPAVGRIPGFKVFANGAGQFSYQRVLSSGLVEQVACDGQTLWHLYPEIGLGTRRPFSRFHFGELARWVPWALPRVEDLAIDSDLRAVDATTIAIVPHPSPSAKKGEKAIVSRELHLVFAVDGSLAESRVVEMPSGKVIVKQTFDAQGNLRLLDADGKQLAERKVERQAVESVNVQPKLDDLVVLDMPLRTSAYREARLNSLIKTKDAAAIQAERLGLFAAASFSRDRDSLAIFGAHFHAVGDKRLGFYTLLSARDHHFHQQPNTWARGIATYDVVQEHPSSALARYLVHQQKNQRMPHEADAKLLEDLPGPPDGFIARMAAFRNAWNTFRLGHSASNHELRGREKRKLFEFVRVNTSPQLAFLLQGNLHYIDSHELADLHKLVYETQKEYVHPLGLGYVFAYEAGNHLHSKGEYKEASRLYRELYERALKEGVLPKIDGSFRSALDDPRSNGPTFGAFQRGVVQEFLKKDRPHGAIMAALQTAQVGSQTLADELFQHILQRLPKNADRLVFLAAMEYVVQSRIDVRADGLCEKLLADPELSVKPSVWRLSSALALQRGQPARALLDLEKALDLEYGQMPDSINLEIVRHDYRELLGHYRVVAKAAQTLEQAPPADLVARVVRNADRWRSLDTDAKEVCQTTAKVLKLLGAKDLAWDYLTTPIAHKPNEGAPWIDLAQELRSDGELELADHAYARAFQSESTNPQILWDRALNLQQLGRIDAARQLWRQIADGVWQERFQALPPQARWHLEIK